MLEELFEGSGYDEVETEPPGSSYFSGSGGVSANRGSVGEVTVICVSPWVTSFIEAS